MNGTGDTGGPGEALVSDLQAKAAIRAALAAYFDAVSRRDWAAVLDGFEPSAHLDYGTPGVETVERNVALLRAGAERLTSSSTLLGLQSCITVDGREARSDTAALTAHCGAEPSAGRARLSMVRYEDEWAHGGDGVWRVRRRTCHHELKAWCELA